MDGVDAVEGLQGCPRSARKLVWGWILLGCALAPALPAARGEGLLPPLAGKTRGPRAVAFAPDGRLAYVAESDSGTIAVLDVAGAHLLRRFSSGGREPAALAAAPGLLLVANRFSGSVAAIDPDSGRLIRQVDLRGEPSGLACTGGRAFVSLGQLNQVAVLRLPTLEVEARIAVGTRPRSVALSPDGQRLLVANLQGGDVSEIDTKTLSETRRFETTGVNLRDVQWTPDGRRAFITGQIAANSRITRDTLDIWTNTLFLADLSTGVRRHSSEGWLDFSGSPAPDPDGVVALGSERAAVVLSGSDEVLLVRTPGPHLRSYDPVVESRRKVGARPRGVALSPDRKTLWVACELDSSLWLLSAADLSVGKRVTLDPPTGLDHRLQGRYLFGSAALTAGGQFSCNSCHPDGGSDGLAWDFTHVPDGLTKRNSRSLRGGIVHTAPFRWSGRETDIEEFFQDEIVGLLRGHRQPHPVLHAFWNLLDIFPLPPNPHRAPGNRLSPAAERGRLLFDGQAGCGGCHAGEMRGGTGVRANVGTRPPGETLDVPHLHGVYDSAPYLHDGRAPDLESVFARFDPEGRHGNASRLSGPERADLLRYVREL